MRWGGEPETDRASSLQLCPHRAVLPLGTFYFWKRFFQYYSKIYQRGGYSLNSRTYLAIDLKNAEKKKCRYNSGKQQNTEAFWIISALPVILEVPNITRGANLQRIEDVVNGVLKAMYQRWIGDYSIMCINWSIYRPIVNWHYEHGAEFCSDELLESLCEHQRVRYEGGEISRKFYRSFVTASFRIRSYVTTGEVDFSIVKDVRRYRPNESYQKIAEAILQSTDLTDGHKKRLSIPIRRFSCFIQERNKGSTQIGDRDFIDFIYEAAKTIWRWSYEL